MKKQKIIKLGPSHHNYNTACAREFLVGHWDETEAMIGQISSISLKLYLAQDSTSSNEIQATIDIVPLDLLNLNFKEEENAGEWKIRTASLSKNYPNSFIYLQQSTGHTNVSSKNYYKKSTRTNLIKEDSENKGLIANRFLGSKEITYSHRGEGYLEAEFVFNSNEILKDLSKWNSDIVVNFCEIEDNNNTSLIFPKSTSNGYWVDKENDIFAQLIIEYTQESSGSLSSSVKLGETSILTINSLNPNYVHSATWKCGEKMSLIEEEIDGKISFNIPADWGKEFPTLNYREGTVTLTTYFQERTAINRIGSQEYPLTYFLPDDAEPVINDIGTIKIDNGIYFSTDKWTYMSMKTEGEESFLCLTNVTTFGIPIEIIPKYGAEISTVLITSQANEVRDGLSVLLKENSYEINIDGTKMINPPNNFNVLLNVTDTRNKSSNVSIPIKFYKYVFPSVTFSFYRCDENGNQQEFEGNYVVFKNEQIIKSIFPECVLYVDDTIPEPTISLMLEGIDTASFNQILDIGTDKNISYSVTLKDSAGYLKETFGTIKSVNYLLHFRKKDEGNKGFQSMGIGCVAPEIDNNLDIAWLTNFKNGITFNGNKLTNIIYYDPSKEGKEQPDVINGAIWLCPVQGGL